MQPKATKLSTTPIKLQVASVLIQQNQCGDFKQMSRFSQTLYMAIDGIFFFCSLTFAMHHRLNSQQLWQYNFKQWYFISGTFSCRAW